MKIICQSCQSKYTVSDEKVQGKTVKIKCRKCGATILVNSSGATNGSGVADPVSYATGGEPGGASYTVNVADGDQRTMTLQEVVNAYNTSVINADTYVWADGMADWTPLGQVEPIVTALNAGAPAPSQPPPAAAYSQPPPAASYSQPPVVAAAPMAGPSFGSHMPEPAPQPMAAAAVPRTAARRDVGRGARDLFGGGGFGAETQPVADDVATSAPLFSAGAVAHTPGPASSRPAAAQSHGAPGQRDENSVLFSLSALTAKAGSSTPIASQTTATKDDSGLIDLRALSAGAPSPTAAGLVPDNAALFPLGMPVASPGSVHPGPLLGIPDAPPANRTPIFIGLGMVVACVAVVGAFFAMKGGDEKPPPAPIETAAPAPVPTPVPTPEPTPEPTAAASATASAVAKTPPRGGGGRPVAKGDSGKSGSGGASPPPAATPPPKKGGCNCAPGDLMCAMKCSTK